MKGDRGHQEKRCQGVAAAPGIARGRIHVFSIETDDVVRYQVDPAISHLREPDPEQHTLADVLEKVA